jgi:WD40 repeat protein
LESPFQDYANASNTADRHLLGATLFGGFKTKPAVSVSVLMFSHVAYNPSDPFYILAVGTFHGVFYLFRVYCNSSDKTINDPIMFHPKETNNVNDQRITEKTHTNVEQLWYNSNAHHDNIIGIAFSMENHTVYTASADASVCLWEIYNGELLRKFKESTKAIAFSAVPSCSSYFLLSNTEGSLWLVDSKKNSLIQKLQFSFNIKSLCFNDTGNLCFAASNTGILLILSMYSSNTYLRLQTHTSISKVLVLITNILI